MSPIGFGDIHVTKPHKFIGLYLLVLWLVSFLTCYGSWVLPPPRQAPQRGCLQTPERRIWTTLHISSRARQGTSTNTWDRGGPGPWIYPGPGCARVRVCADPVCSGGGKDTEGVAGSHMLSGSLAIRYSVFSGFRPIFGQTWPQNPSNDGARPAVPVAPKIRGPRRGSGAARRAPEGSGGALRAPEGPRRGPPVFRHVEVGFSRC